MCFDVIDHVCLLSERSATNLASIWFLAGMDPQVLLEIELLALDEEATDGAVFVIRPMVIHVLVEVFQVSELCLALDAVRGPVVALAIVLVVGVL